MELPTATYGRGGTSPVKGIPITTELISKIKKVGKK